VQTIDNSFRIVICWLTYLVTCMLLQCVLRAECQCVVVDSRISRICERMLSVHTCSTYDLDRFVLIDSWFRSRHRLLNVNHCLFSWHVARRELTRRLFDVFLLLLLAASFVFVLDTPLFNDWFHSQSKHLFNMVTD
jgi:hypothetical protein